MFFNGWEAILRILVVGMCAYTLLILLLRVSGKRTLSKMNAFDLIVTVALGSTLATILLSKEVALAEGVAALGLLVFLQFIITWLSVRFEGFQQAVKANPTLLVYRGQVLDDVLRRERISREELKAALRSAGHASTQVAAVVMETDGTITVVEEMAVGEDSALTSVKGYGAPSHDS